MTNVACNPEDVPNGMDEPMPDAIPVTNAGDFAYTFLDYSDKKSVPCHVLFNQAAALCTRWNRRIKGSRAQQNFIQRLVSTIQGASVPLLYLMACCFPRHFYASATHDPCAILCASPLSCYTKQRTLTDLRPRYLSLVILERTQAHRQARTQSSGPFSTTYRQTR